MKKSSYKYGRIFYYGLVVGAVIGIDTVQNFV